MFIDQKLFDQILQVSPVITVDGVIIKDKKILLTKRAIEPERGTWILPGGFLQKGELIKEAVLREIKEETGIVADIAQFVNIYDDVDSDPRGHFISVTYLCTHKTGTPGPNDGECDDVRFFPLNALPENIGFNHRKKINDAARLLP